MKRKALFLAALVVMTLVVLACQWVLARGHALAILEDEIAAGLVVDWKLPTWTEGQPYLAKIWPGSTPRKVHVNYKMLDPKALGDTLCHFGSLEKLSIGGGDAENIHDFLSHCGGQPKLKSLMIFSIEIDERLYAILEHWNAIQILAIVPSKLTSEAFPRMPELRDINASYSPINNAGLIRLVSCPKIENIYISATELSSSTILDAVRLGKSHLHHLRLGDVKLLGDDNTPEGRDKLRYSVHKIASELQFKIDG